MIDEAAEKTIPSAIYIPQLIKELKKYLSGEIQIRLGLDTINAVVIWQPIIGGELSQKIYLEGYIKFHQAIEMIVEKFDKMLLV